jgi:galacturan 1,4-alpha-galacturonidase
VTPVTATPLPNGPATLVLRNLMNIEELYAGIKERNLDRIFSSFINQPLCSGLSIADAHALFGEMTRNTASYLPSFTISSK